VQFISSLRLQKYNNFHYLQIFRQKNYNFFLILFYCC